MCQLVRNLSNRTTSKLILWITIELVKVNCKPHRKFTVLADTWIAAQWDPEQKVGRASTQTHDPQSLWNHKSVFFQSGKVLWSKNTATSNEITEWIQGKFSFLWTWFSSLVKQGRRYTGFFVGCWVYWDKTRWDFRTTQCRLSTLSYTPAPHTL